LRSNQIGLIGAGKPETAKPVNFFAVLLACGKMKSQRWNA